MKKVLLTLCMMLTGIFLWAQIFEGEGLNIPGTWNGFTNPPATNSPFGSQFQVTGGRVTKITTGAVRWQTIFSTAEAGGAGGKAFLFTTGPGGNPYQNKWANVNVSMNTLQNYTFNSGPDNNVTLGANMWYTVNWIDAGYTGTQAIFMETSAQPVTINTVSQSPLNGSVTDSSPVVVTVNASAAPSAEEKVYLRYAINGNFAASTQVLVNFTGSVGTATIPAQSAATVVSYYVFSTTITNPAIADIDKVTIRFKNAEPGNFTYTVNTPDPPVNVTFRVNMSQQTLTGPVRIWTSVNGVNTLTNEGGGLYATTFSLNQGTNLTYKFINDNTYEGNLGAPCGNGVDRTWTVGTSNETIPTVCFGSCNNCPPTHQVTFRVNMISQFVGGNVFINGNFPPANWATPQQMTSIGGGVYEYTATLAEGLSFEYKFINGFDYEGNLGAPCGNGSNRTWTVGTTNEIIPTACFSSCSNCATPIPVTFRVNMSEQVVTNNEVYVMGSFYPSYWSTPQLMTHQGGGIYTFTTNLSPGTSFEYKFINDPTYEPNIGGPCGNGTNRTYTVPALPSALLPLVCFGSCNDCDVVVPTYAVTFRVNMANVAISNFGVHLAGSFGNAGYPNWQPNGINMTDANNDGVYEVTLQLNPNTTYQYKFLNGNNWGMDESVPGACAVGLDRQISVAESNLTIPAVCFGACTNCSVPANNDNFYSAIWAPASGISFPQSQCYNGTLVGATVSPQGSAANVQGGGGQDRWHRIIAPSSAMRVIATTSAFNMVLELHSANGLLIDTENSVPGFGGETMTTTGLTPGAVYYIAVRSFDGTVGAYSVCLQVLSASFVAGTTSNYELCSNLKSQWTGANSYTYIFTGTGITPVGPTQVTVSGQVPLSTAALGLRYGGTYNVRVDANYTSISEPVTVPGIVITGITIEPHALLETKATQACPAVLLRGSILNAKPFVCGATNFTVEFQRVTDCTGLTNIDPLPFTVNTAGASSNLQLGFTSPQPLQAQSWYRVRWRPNFSYGTGNYGATSVIFIGGSVMNEESEVVYPMLQKDLTNMIEASVYPNPNTGERVNLNLTGLNADNVFVRIMDSMGRVVYTNRYTVDGSLNTIVNFTQPLTSGLYLVEFSSNGQILTERMIVER